MSIEEVELVVPVAVPFEMIEQSVPKLFIFVMLTPCSLLGVSAMIQASDELLVEVTVFVLVLLPWAATERALTVKPLFERPIQLSTTAPRLKLWVLLKITSPAPDGAAMSADAGAAMARTA